MQTSSLRSPEAAQRRAAKIQVSILLPNISWIFLDKVAFLG